MTNPHFYGQYGQEDHRRDFVVAAREAQRSLRASADIKLIAPDVKLAGDGDRSMRVTADSRDFYEDDDQALSLQGDVAVDSGDGTTFATQQALVDMRNRARWSAIRPFRDRAPLDRSRLRPMPSTTRARRWYSRGRCTPILPSARTDGRGREARDG